MALMIDWLTKMAERHGVDAGWTVAILAAAVAVWQWADKHLREHYRDTIDDRNDAIDQRDGLNDTLRAEVDRLGEDVRALKASLDRAVSRADDAEESLQRAMADHAEVEAQQDTEIQRLRAKVERQDEKIALLKDDLHSMTPHPDSDAWESP